MNYIVVVANGDALEEIIVQYVDHVLIEEGRYILYDKHSEVLFCAPESSLVYLKLQ